MLQRYTITTLDEVLTPAERENYLETGILPSWLTAGPTDSYVAGAGGGRMRRTIRRRPRKRNTRKGGNRMIPRWMYFIEKMMLGFRMIPGLGANTSLLGIVNGGAADQGEKPRDGLAAENTKTSRAVAYQTALDVLNSELGQQVIKAGVGYFPGGRALVKAYENRSQIQSALTGAASLVNTVSRKTGKGGDTNKAAGFTYQNVKDLAASDAGQEALKMGISFLPGGGTAVKVYENSDKLSNLIQNAGVLKNKRKLL